MSPALSTCDSGRPQLLFPKTDPFHSFGVPQIHEGSPGVSFFAQLRRSTMQANSYLRQSMRGRCRVFLLIRDMPGLDITGKTFAVFWWHLTYSLQRMFIPETMSAQHRLPGHAEGLSSSLGGLASSKWSLPKNHQRLAVRSLAVISLCLDSCYSWGRRCTPLLQTVVSSWGWEITVEFCIENWLQMQHLLTQPPCSLCELSHPLNSGDLNRFLLSSAC